MKTLCNDCGFEGEYPTSCQPCFSCQGWLKPAPPKENSEELEDENMRRISRCVSRINELTRQIKRMGK